MSTHIPADVQLRVSIDHRAFPDPRGAAGEEDLLPQPGLRPEVAGDEAEGDRRADGSGGEMGELSMAAFPAWYPVACLWGEWVEQIVADLAAAQERIAELTEDLSAARAATVQFQERAEKNAEDARQMRVAAEHWIEREAKVRNERDAACREVEGLRRAIRNIALNCPATQREELLALSAPTPDSKEPGYECCPECGAERPKGAECIASDCPSRTATPDSKEASND